ncbi:MAG: alkyl hydroperoxide reductase subunit F, partial [Leptospira sp.]|nr:alkyl hydroperoxide reductase subunit F [Leptospira sp.]
MVDESLKEQLKEYFQRLTKNIDIVYDTGDHEHKSELVDYLTAVAECSDKITLKENSQATKNPLHFSFFVDGTDSGVYFDGIPGGHEFSSFVLAILQVGGSPIRLDEGIQARLKTITEPLEFETVVSLECHNCPDVVQTLNSISLLNPNIKHTMIDGSLFPDLVEKRKVQGVPSVFLNGDSFATGKVDASTIIERLLEKSTSNGSNNVEVKDDGAPQKIYDVAVIGGGPAGVASAVYSARKGLKVLVIADKIGGQVKDTMGIENLISTLQTTGPELTGVLSEQLKHNGVEVKQFLRVKELQDAPEGHPKKIVTNSGEVIQSKTVIIATGAKWRELNVPGEKENIGNGVAYCPHCDGPFFKGKDVAVIGGGNSGVEAALDLSGIVKSVTVLEFADSLRADQVLLDRMDRTPNITVHASAQTTEVLARDGKVHALTYKDRTSDEIKTIDLDGVFVQIGLIPNSDFAKGILEMNRFGEIIVDDKCKTNIPGIFACGDVTTTPY